MAGRDSRSSIRQSQVQKDWVDNRDYRYEPTLSILPGSYLPDPNIFVDNGGIFKPRFGVRDQGQSSRCTGFALAALIDLQRRLQLSPHDTLKDDDLVSADMLYWMAAFHDRDPDPRTDRTAAQNNVANVAVRSLRSVIKGFYHHGVCLDNQPNVGAVPPERWQSEDYSRTPAPPSEQPFPSVDQQKAARSICLGAYFRVASILNHYHAAIKEAGGLLVSANVHDGWRAPYRQKAKGVIDPNPKSGGGTHAFVIVGYNKEGFLVLNSWGERWGGYEGYTGIALWSYSDWAQHVVDGWVLRLGVSAPDAFDSGIGLQGTDRLFSAITAHSMPCYELSGHYMNLDDGFHVEAGSYPSSEKHCSKTYEHLAKTITQKSIAAACKAPTTGKDCRGLVIWIPGSLEGIEPAFRTATRRRATIEALGLYPYTIFWCSNFVEKSLEVLTLIFESCRERVGEPGEQLNALIEARVRGVGRAFWRDIEQSARRAVFGTPELPDDAGDKGAPPGPLAEMFETLFKLRKKTGMELHLVAEGAGALVLHEVIRYFVQEIGKKHSDIAAAFTTMSLFLPAIDVPRSEKHILPVISLMNKRRGLRQTDVPFPGHLNGSKQTLIKRVPPARIYLSAPNIEERASFGDYRGSVLRLVARSFEDRLDPEPRANGGVHLPPNHPSFPPRKFLGLLDGKKLPTQGGRFGTDKAVLVAFSKLRKLHDPRFRTGRIPQSGVMADQGIEKEIFRTIRLVRDREAASRNVRDAKRHQGGRNEQDFRRRTHGETQQSGDARA